MNKKKDTYITLYVRIKKSIYAKLEAESVKNTRTIVGQLQVILEKDLNK